MKYWKGDSGAITTIIVIIVLFFLPLFWPEQQLLVTPDFGKSDSWHFSFATKYALWESLHQGKLPLWSDKIGDGFPMFAEGQIGTFFLPNLILFRFLNDPVLAYNLSLVITIIIVATGMYVWLRTLTLSLLPSLFGALTFTFSGIVILQLPHITLIQGFSLLPWIMAVQSPVWLLALLVSQQIFAGFPQATFLTLLLAGSWAVYRKKILPFVFAVFLGIGLSAVQLIPSWEFLKQSGHTLGLPPEISSYFSFPLAHLKSFFNPFALGDPKMGTYPHFSEFDGSIFWENTGYIGLFPLFLFLIAVRFRSRLTSFFLFILLGSFLLMWGSHSPIYLIFSFWPFSLFRVPSRFLWLFVFSLITLAAIGAQTVKKKHHMTLFTLLALVNTAQLFFLWRPYHLLVPAKTFLGKPAISTLIPQEARIVTIGSEKTHNKFFLTSGWQQSEPYQSLRSSLAPDSNLLWNISQHDVYAGRTLRRPAILDSLLGSHIRVGENQATISAVASKLLNLMGVTHVVSTMPLLIERGLQKPIIYDESFLRLSVNTTAVPRAYLARETKQVVSVEQAIAGLTDERFEPGKTVLVEKTLNLPALERATAIITRSDPDYVAVRTEAVTESLLVLSDTYYPGWTAYVDGVPTQILPANIRYRAVVVPKGKHEVNFVYQPKSFILGLILTVFAASALLSQIRLKGLEPVFHRRMPVKPRPHRA